MASLLQIRGGFVAQGKAQAGDKGQTGISRGLADGARAGHALKLGDQRLEGSVGINAEIISELSATLLLLVRDAMVPSRLGSVADTPAST